jgi:hypothetical protein
MTADLNLFSQISEMIVNRSVSLYIRPPVMSSIFSCLIVKFLMMPKIDSLFYLEVPLFSFTLKVEESVLDSLFVCSRLRFLLTKE